MRRIPVLLLLGLLICLFYGRVVDAQRKSLSLDVIYGPGAWERFNGNPAAFLGWLADPWVDDAHYLWPAGGVGRSDNQSWLKVDALSGKGELLFDPAKLAAALAKLPRISTREASLATRQRPTRFNARHDGFLLTVGS